MKYRIEYRSDVRMPRIRMVLVVLTLGIGMIAITGCSKKDSGLYQVSVQAKEAEVEKLGDEKSDKSESQGDDTGMTGLDSEASNSGMTDSVSTSTEVIDSGGEHTNVAVETHIYVHICGSVCNPGVYEFEPGQRVFHAVEAAGGFTEDACESYVNQALELTDGMKIVIPSVEEIKMMSDDEAGLASDTELGIQNNTGDSGSGNVNATDNSGKVNINSADADTLGTIPGIGPTKAAAIITYRETVGRFNSIEEIKNVSGIGESTYSKMRDSITVGE